MLQQISVNELTPIWLKAEHHNEPCCIVDVRESGEHAQVHIPGVVHVALSSIQEHCAAIPDDQPVYMICHGGVRSAQAANWLRREKGYSKLINVEGGMVAWIQAGLSVVRG